MFKSILVPLDGTHFAEHALPLAASMAERAGASLRLLQVMPPLADRYFWAPTPGTTLERDLREHFRSQAQLYMESVARRLRQRVPFTSDVLDEQIDLSLAIETEVIKSGSDLVVMPSHGRNTLERFWFGSVADQVYRTSSVPVLLTKPQQAQVDFDREVSIRQILVALDGSPQGEEVLDPVLTLGLALDADFLLVRVTDSPVPHDSSLEPVSAAPGTPVPAIDDRLRQNPGGYLRAIADGLRAKGARVRTQLLASADPVDAIVRAAETLDLIAIKTHARRGVSRLFHGSIADQIVHNSRVPVLVTRPHGH